MRSHRVKNKRGKLLTNQTTVIVDITICKTTLVRAAEHQSSSELEDDPEPHRHFKAGIDPFSPDRYRGKARTYIKETLQVPGSHRNHFPRPFVIRDADFNRTLVGCSTGAKQEAEVLYTASAFLCLQLNGCNEFIEEHPKLNKDSRRHLKDNWVCQLGIYEILLARLDIIEGRQGDFQSQALAESQQARGRPLLDRGSISAETYQICLPADTRAKVSAAASSKNRHSRDPLLQASQEPQPNRAVRRCYALLRMRPLSILCAECSVVISCGKVDYDKSG
jgi:hypothetical protein